MITHTEKRIADELESAILNQRPKDIIESPSCVDDEHEWFIVSDDQVVWNWRNRVYPAWLVAKKLGVLEEYLELEWHDRTKIVDRVLSRKTIREFKKKVKGTA